MVQKSDSSRRALGITKYHKLKGNKRTVVIFPLGIWRTAVDLALDNDETFSSLLNRALRNEINMKLGEIPKE